MDFRLQQARRLAKRGLSIRKTSVPDKLFTRIELGLKEDEKSYFTQTLISCKCRQQVNVKFSRGSQAEFEFHGEGSLFF